MSPQSSIVLSYLVYIIVSYICRVICTLLQYFGGSYHFTFENSAS